MSSVDGPRDAEGAGTGVVRRRFTARALRFADAVQAEIDEVKRQGGDRSLELKHGTREPRSPRGAFVYTFVRSDDGLLPEDAPATLSVGDDVEAGEVLVVIVGQEADRVRVMLEAHADFGETIPTATLHLRQTELLVRLQERMEELAGGAQLGLAPKVFGDELATVGFGRLPERVASRLSEGSMVSALEQAIGSEVTFLWGPPGTGKTFSIAAVVTVLVEAGETVFVTSHTHAAVEQAVWAAVEPAARGREPGLLAGSPLVAEGKLLKLGPLRDPKIPAECHLGSLVELLAREREAEREQARAALAEARRDYEEAVRAHGVWQTLDEAEAAFTDAGQALVEATETMRRSDIEFVEAAKSVETAGERLGRARRSFVVGRRWRVRRASRALEIANDALVTARGAVTRAEAEWRDRVGAVDETGRHVDAARVAVREAGDREQCTRRLTATSARVRELAERADHLARIDPDVAQKLLTDARALFATLTKLYVDPALAERTWETVVIDEASMAMPPLVAWAASRARRRVIICGDFHQLPPVVRSRSGIAAEKLGTDVFHLRDIPAAVGEGQVPLQLAPLRVQRRMHPAIADVARELAYGDENLVDHPGVITRQWPEWLDGSVITETADIPEAGAPTPIWVVDISAYGATCRHHQQSWFNRTSADVSLAIAARFAACVPEPGAGETRRIGIVTPYAPQRRYLSTRVGGLGDLASRVIVGTVHTFQGNECDLVVFDSVLAAPARFTRLTHPQAAASVRRDLNVAVTRARHMLVFVGDVPWLDRHAVPGTGLGCLWVHLRRVAPIIDGSHLVAPNWPGSAR